ncbi:MAG: hypothetical protein ABI721_02285 [Candidatus Dojkabacteria bacterium]
MEENLRQNSLDLAKLHSIIDHQISALRVITPNYSIGYPVNFAKYREVWNYDIGRSMFLEDIRRTIEILRENYTDISSEKVDELLNQACILVQKIFDQECKSVLEELVTTITKLKNEGEG